MVTITEAEAEYDALVRIIGDRVLPALNSGVSYLQGVITGRKEMPEDVKARIAFLHKEHEVLAKKFIEQRGRPYNDPLKKIEVLQEREQKMMEYLAEINILKKKYS
jgi:hypothetical protein